MSGAVALARRVRTRSAASTLHLAFGEAGDYEELRHFRDGIFRDELRIQHPDYQDVFNDYVSKNVLLRRDGFLEAAVRLAFSRDTGRFFISYLSVRALRRNYASHVGLLLGAIFHLMRENGIGSVHGHAADENLPMYIQAGCRPEDEKFRKYGFACQWTPIQYVAGTRPSEEERLVSRVREHLGRGASRWSFAPRVALCRDSGEFADALRRLISTREIFGTIPHISERVDPAMIGSRFVHDLSFVAAADLTTGHEPNFDFYNDRFDPSRIIAVRTGDGFADLARSYAMLLGRRLCVVNEWTELTADENICDVVALACVADRAPAEAAQPLFRGHRWRVAFAGSPGEMSLMLLSAYLRGLGPTGGEELPI